jgi:hypothetical protein
LYRYHISMSSLSTESWPYDTNKSKGISHLAGVKGQHSGLVVSAPVSWFVQLSLWSMYSVLSRWVRYNVTHSYVMNKVKTSRILVQARTYIRKECGLCLSRVH